MEIMVARGICEVVESGGNEGKGNAEESYDDVSKIRSTRVCAIGTTYWGKGWTKGDVMG